MKYEQLPKRLQVEGVQLIDPDRKQIIKLNDSIMEELEQIVKPVLERKQKGA